MSDVGRLKVFEVNSGALRHDLAGHSQAFAVAFSAEGAVLASGGRWADGAEHGNGVIVWDVASGKKTRTLAIESNGGTLGLASSPTRKMIAIASRNFDKENDTSSTAIGVAYPLSGITEWQRTFAGGALPKAFSPDGKRLLVQSRQSIVVLNVETGQDQHELKPADEKSIRWNDFALASQGPALAIGGSTSEQKGFVELWDLTGSSK